MKTPQPGATPVPPAVLRQRRQPPLIPQYAHTNVRLVTVRSAGGYNTGIGLPGPAVAERVMSLAEAKTLLGKVTQLYRGTLTRGIPNIGLAVVPQYREYLDGVNYAEVQGERQCALRTAGLQGREGEVQNAMQTPPHSASGGVFTVPPLSKPP